MSTDVLNIYEQQCSALTSYKVTAHGQRGWLSDLHPNLKLILTKVPSLSDLSFIDINDQWWLISRVRCQDGNQSLFLGIVLMLILDLILLTTFQTAMSRNNSDVVTTSSQAPKSGSKHDFVAIMKIKPVWISLDLQLNSAKLHSSAQHKSQMSWQHYTHCI